DGLFQLLRPGLSGSRPEGSHDTQCYACVDERKSIAFAHDKCL
ncbi:MAG: hypothetical protein ACI8RN_002753, partial [Glaciecola sp.]